MPYKSVHKDAKQEEQIWRAPILQL